MQTSPSSQFGPEPPAQTPWPLHWSFVVHSFPSSQAAVLFVKTQPVAGLQLSLVQTSLSLQPITVPWHEPPLHVSPDVQALPSLQGAVLLVWTQPVAGLHESFVQGLLSLQLTGAPE